MFEIWSMSLMVLKFFRCFEIDFESTSTLIILKMPNYHLKHFRFMDHLQIWLLITSKFKQINKSLLPMHK